MSAYNSSSTPDLSQLVNDALALRPLQEKRIKLDDQQGLYTYLKIATEIPERRIHMVHGTGFCAMTLAAMASQLPSEWEIALTDLPGHGQSSQPKRGMPDWQAIAAAVNVSVEQQLQSSSESESTSANLKQVTGVGHSMGGVILLLAASQRPELYERLILLDPVLFPRHIIGLQRIARTTGLWKKMSLVNNVSARRNVWPDRSTMQKNLSSKHLYRNWHPQALSDFAQYGSRENNDEGVTLRCDPRWEASIFGSFPRGLWTAVSRVSVPVHILVADKSYGFIPSAVKRAASRNPNITWQSFGHHHCFPMEQPEETATQIKTLLD